MTSLADAYYHVKYNPFKFGGHIVAFYGNLKGVEQNLLLSQLIIPLCTHPIFGKKIEGAVFGKSKRSSVWTIFDDRAKLFDLQDRIDEFKSLTNQAMQYAIVNDWVSIDKENFVVSPISDLPSDVMPDIPKCAVNLGKLFSQYSAIEIFTLLGVIPR